MQGQAAETGTAISPEEAAKRLQFLKSVESNVVATPAPKPAFAKKRFAETRSLGVRLEELPPASTVAGAPGKPPGDGATAGSKGSPVADVPTVKTPAKETASGEAKAPSAHHATTPAPANIAEAHSAEPHAKATPSGSKVSGTHAATPAPATIAEGPTVELHAKATPAPETKTLHPAPIATGPAASNPADTLHHDANVIGPKRIAAATPAPKASPTPSRSASVASTRESTELRIVDTHPLDTPKPRPYVSRSDIMGGRYPWKTGIVTTVFWIGEPVGGNNFTPNCSSSWDANWTRSYGGYDNPNPESRRNFMPVSFTPRQNPFYVALPYNDVTRGTTKPEARIVIPWFKEAFRKEGQSVCRDRWVEVRNREGRVAYAQWSDCGPFRTDHWQYVFGLERPKPNLNQGAGLDVSPALRDYLGLQSTDLTDWKFVDSKDVQSGPWLLYGDNNPFAQQRRYRMTKADTKPEGVQSVEVAVIRARGY